MGAAGHRGPGSLPEAQEGVTCGLRPCHPGEWDSAASSAQVPLAQKEDLEVPTGWHSQCRVPGPRGADLCSSGQRAGQPAEPPPLPGAPGLLGRWSADRLTSGSLVCWLLVLISDTGRPCSGCPLAVVPCVTWAPAGMILFRVLGLRQLCPPPGATARGQRAPWSPVGCSPGGLGVGRASAREATQQEGGRTVAPGHEQLEGPHATSPARARFQQDAVPRVLGGRCESRQF